MRPHVRTAVTNAPHPSFAPGRAYSQEFRALALWVREQGLEDEEVFQRSRDLYLFPAVLTVDRHETRDEQLGTST